MTKRLKTFTESGASETANATGRLDNLSLDTAMESMDTSETEDSAQSENLSVTGQSSASYILKLPDEILLCIANKLANQRDILQLAQVNEKLRRVAQETLWKDLYTPSDIRKILMVLRILCQRHDLASKIKHIKVAPYIHFDTVTHYIAAMQQLSQCGPTVDHFRGAGFFNNLRNAWSAGITPQRAPQLILDIFIAMAPNLTSLTINLVPIPEQSEPYEPEQILPPSTLNFLESSLQSLQVLPTPLCFGPMYQYLRHVSLLTLTHCTRLSIPMNAVMLNRATPHFPEDILPPNLTTLQLNPCNKHIGAWLYDFKDALREGYLTGITRLDLCFEHPSFRPALILAAQGKEEASILDILHSTLLILSQNQTLTLRYYLNNKPAPDLLDELEAWVHMRDFEHYWAATKGLEFSQVVKRTLQGKPTSRSALEIRALLRETQFMPVIATRRGAGFDPRVFLGGVPCLRFAVDEEEEDVDEEEKPPEELQRYTFDAREWAEVCAFWGVETH